MKKIQFSKDLELNLKNIDNKKIRDVLKLLLNLKKKNKVIIAGNGGSASIASHVAIDLTKAAGIRAINFNEPNLLTCFSNDYGYKNWLKKALEFYSLPGDILILISSSGKSENIINGAKISKKLGINLITLSGFSKKNTLVNKGLINFHVPSSNYNVVESMHLIILLQIVENLIDKKIRI
jgi:D-sedoheptulose 7-phosphate isomerase